MCVPACRRNCAICGPRPEGAREPLVSKGLGKMPKYAKPDEYIADHNAPIAALLTELRAFIHAELPGASEKMRYGVPVFLNEHDVPVLYLFGASDHVNFGFLRFDALSDPDAVLVGSGKPSKHIEIRPGDPIDHTLLRSFIAQCSDLAA